MDEDERSALKILASLEPTDEVPGGLVLFGRAILELASEIRVLSARVAALERQAKEDS